MTNTTTLAVQMGRPLNLNTACETPLQIDFEFPLECPYCPPGEEQVSSWGSYPTRTGEVTRFYCYTCQRSFNPAKLPFWKEVLPQLVNQVVQLTILHELPTSALAETLHVPETTLRRLHTEIRDLLAANLELIHQLEEVLAEASSPTPKVLRVLFVDEGFLKLAGKCLYLIFAVSQTGEPLDVQIVYGTSSHRP